MGDPDEWAVQGSPFDEETALYRLQGRMGKEPSIDKLFEDVTRCSELGMFAYLVEKVDLPSGI